MMIAAADVGSIKSGNFAWSTDRIVEGTRVEGTEITDLADVVRRTLDAGERVALGFECPLAVPVPEKAADIGRQREGEAGRPWGVMAGAYTLAVGLVELSWVLDRLGEVAVTVVPSSWSDEAPLLLWEAFVSGPHKPTPSMEVSAHINDARAAVQGFACVSAKIPAIGRINTGNHRSLNLAAFAALAAGLRIDQRELNAPILVLDGKGELAAV